MIPDGSGQAESRRLRPPLWYLALVLLAFVPATFIQRSFTAASGQSVWTPALGMVFAVMVLYGTRWVPLLVGTLMVVTAVDSIGKHIASWSMVTALLAVIVVGYAAGALIARSFSLRCSLRRLRDAVLLSVASLAGTVIAISGAILVVEAFGYMEGHSWWSTMWRGWASAGASTLAIAPVVILGGSWLMDRAPAAGSHGSAGRLPWRQRLVWIGESAAQAGAFAGAASLAVDRSGPRFYPLFVPLGWLALRRGIAGTAIGVAIGTTALSVFAHSSGLKASDLNALEIFILVFTLCGICFGAAQTERVDFGRQVAASRRALALSEERFRLLVATNPDYAIFMVDPDGKVLTWNSGAEFLTGYSQQDVIGRSVSVLDDQNPEAAETHLHSVLVTAREEGNSSTEQWLRHKDGRSYLARVLTTAIRADNGTLLGFGQTTHDITDSRRKEEQLTDRATRDHLTRLLNKPAFMEQVVTAQARNERGSGLIALLYLDLDGFKPVNDVHGHQMGDRALAVVADRIRGCLRPADVAARLGGDEFAVLCEGLPSREETDVIVERIKEAVRQPLEIGGVSVVLTASAGVAFSGPHDDPAAVLHQADQAMYGDKGRTA